MSQVRLGRYEVEDYELPRVCMRCGARATSFKRKKFQWYPPWALLFGIFGPMLFSKTLVIPVPLCPRHKWHWTGRAALVGFSLPAIPLFFLAAAVPAAMLDARPAFVFVPTLVVFVAWCVMAVVLLGTVIRPAEITDKSITLKGVSGGFIAALEEDRRGHPDEDDEGARPGLRRWSRDGGYYDPETRRRPRDEDYR
jgi:hypothetical protein